MALYEQLATALRAGRPVALATVVAGPGCGQRALVGREGLRGCTIEDGDLARVVIRDASGQLDAGRTGLRHYGPRGEAGQEEVTVFVETFAPPPLMLVFGAVDFTAALVRIAKVLGYRVSVCDARAPFATATRFPHADEVLVEWPHRVIEREAAALGPADAICVLTHDAKFDVPALMAALATDVGYIGAMGSRRTHAERVRQLEAAGATPADLERIMAPIGLDIGARTPEETAVSICAEIVAARSGRTRGSLSKGEGPIH